MQSKMQPLHSPPHATSLSRKLQSLHFYAVLLGTILWLCATTITTVRSEEHYGQRVGRKLSSPLFNGEDQLLDGAQLSNEDLHSLLSILQGRQREQEEQQQMMSFSSTSTQRAPTILPELIRHHQNAPSSSPTTPPTTTSTTGMLPVSRVTTRRFYRRLRRKPTTQSPDPMMASSSSTTEARLPMPTIDSSSSGRMLPSTEPGELLNQLSLLNGILGALNSSTSGEESMSSSPAPAPPSIAPSITPNSDNAHKDNATSVHDTILAYLSGAKMEGSSKSEVVVPPPSPTPQQVDDNTANALALLNLFSGGNDNKNGGGGGNSNSAQGLLNLMGQSQQQPSPSSSSISDADATAALTKLLLQSSAPSNNQPMQSNSIQQSNSDQQSANQLTSLLGLLGTLGAAAGGGLQQPQSSAGNINNLFNLGGDQQTAQAQQANSLASLFGGQGQQHQQNQNLLNLFGGNQNQAGGQAAQGFNLASLLVPQSGGNSIPGLGLLSTMTSLGSSIFSTVSNIFGGAGQGGKPRVRGKGVDTRLGLGYRLGDVGDAQIVWDIGPQLFTDPLRNELRPSYSNKKRESGAGGVYSSSSSSSPYLAPASVAAVEKEVQKTEAKRRMVQSAIQDHYHRNDYDHFAGAYPQKYRRSNSHFDYAAAAPVATTIRPYYYHPSTMMTTSTTAKPSFFSGGGGFNLPFTDHLKGFWSGLTSTVTSTERNNMEEEDTTPPGYYNNNFDDIRHDFSTNLIKRSSPDYGSWNEGRSYHGGQQHHQHQQLQQQPRRRQDDYDTEEEPNHHSTLTDYERMLLQYGKDIGVGGVADTRNGVGGRDEPVTGESSIFDRWFKSAPSPSSTAPSSMMSEEMDDDDRSYRRGMMAPPPSNGYSHSRSEWGAGSMASGSNEYPVRSKPPKKGKTYGGGHDKSFTQRIDHSRRREGQNNKNNKGRAQRPQQQRRSHNPFRNWLSALKPQSHHHHHNNHHHDGGQRPRSSSSQHSHYAGFGRRHYKQRPGGGGGGNPKLQHFTNMNKDLMMADANIDDFVESAGVESLPGAYDRPMTYGYQNEFPDVPLEEMPPRRLRPTSTQAYRGGGNKLRASLSQRDQVVEPALLYDHLEVRDDDGKPPSEADESFHQRNKVVVNPKLKEMEKQKVFGTMTPSSASSSSPGKVPVSLSKLQRIRLNKLRANVTGGGMRKQKIIVKVKGKGQHGQFKSSPSPPSSQSSGSEHEHGHHEEASESSTALPSVLSTIGSLFSGTTKPKLFTNLIQNATSYLPSIRILPRKKNNKDQRTKLTFMNGQPTVVGPPEDEDDLEAEGAELPPVVQVGHDMSFGDLQTIFSSSKDNSTKRRRFRIRVKDSVLKGSEKKDSSSDPEKERSDSEEDNDEEAKDIFVDIESGEVSVLKPVASLVSFAPKAEEPSQEEEIDYYEDDDGDGVPDMDMKRKEHIFAAIQSQLVRNFDKLKKAEAKAEAKKRRKEELAQKGMDESMDQVMKIFDYHTDDQASSKEKEPKLPKFAGGLAL